MSKPAMPRESAPRDAAGSAAKEAAQPASQRPWEPERVDPNFGVLPPAQRYARYSQERLLGRGGMGEVELCRDSVIGRRVAIKRIVALHATDDTMRSRFLREARIQGQLQHPAILPVYDLGHAEDGSTFFTMKQLGGATLSSILDAQRAGDETALAQYPLRRLLDMFTAVCHAVQFAHASDVLHRDLKPANIMLGDFGEVYVLDWGIAQIASQPAQGLHQSGQSLVGTLGYMSPEQARGLLLDVKSDVYALGAILFEIITRQPLHPRSGQMAMLFATVQGRHSARPSERIADSDVAPELEDACVRATSLDPAARFESVAELRDAVQRFQDGERDMALRKDLAGAHTKAAEEAAACAMSGAANSLDARQRALREVGRALALDPSSQQALRTLARILTEPPSELPERVTEQLAVQARQRQLKRARSSWISASGVLILMLLGTGWMGVRDWRVISAMVIAVLGGATVAAIRPQLPGWARTLFYMECLCRMSAIVLLSRAFGSLVLMLPAALIMAAVFGATEPAPNSHIGLAATLSTVLGTIGLEATGVIDASFDFHGTTLSIVSTAVNHPQWPTLVSLTAFSVFTSIALFWAMFSLKKLNSAAEHDAALRNWHLQQLLPEDAG